MKLYSQHMELSALCTIARRSTRADGASLDVNKVTELSSHLLSHLDESHFYYEPCKVAYNRIVSIARKRSRILNYDELLEDPVIPEDMRDVLRESRKRPLRDLDSVDELLSGLDKYKKSRALYFMSKAIVEGLKEDSVDVDALMDSATESLSKLRASSTDAQMVLTIGRDANALDFVEEALSVEDENLYKTGYKEFDDKSGGLPSEGVFILAATTSGGKSTLRMNLVKNMYYLNKIDVVTVSLEMNARKETRRLLSCLTGIEYWKFVRKSLSEAERDAARMEWTKVHKFGKKNECRYSMLCPTRGLTIHQLLTLIKPYGFKVIAIDYISLLDGVSNQDQWRVLADISRECKIFSSETKCLVILLAQLDSSDDRIRYSQGIAENADNVWVWNYAKQEQRDLKILPIRQLKARDQELFPFDLRENFEFMQVLNMDDDTGHDDSSSTLMDDPLADPDVAVE